MFSAAYNKTLEHLILPAGDRLEGGSFVQWLRRYRSEQWLPFSQLKQIQRERLEMILRHARSNVPFYKNVTPASDPFEEIKSFPIIRKHELNNCVDDLTVRPKESLIAESGSGSSGIQSTVYMDKSAQASQRAMQMLWFEWSGYRLGDSILQTGITPKRGVVKKTKDLLLKTDYVPAFDLSPSAVQRILKKAAAKKDPSYLFGYASSLYVLAQAALESGLDGLSFRYAVSWGDKLFPHYREAIRRAFGCETLDTYGCTEGAMVGAECTQGSFHLSINQCYVEIVSDDGHPVSPGNMGKVLVTRLDNFSMPLIRYYLGDLAELAPDDGAACACGRGLPLLKRVIGRDTDIVRTRSGKQMIVHFFTGIFEHIPQIKQFKVVQQELDGIEIHYIPGAGFSPDVLSQIERTIGDHLKESFPVMWIRTERIEPTKSGKPQIIQSFLRQSLTHSTVSCEPETL